MLHMRSSSLYDRKLLSTIFDMIFASDNNDKESKQLEHEQWAPYCHDDDDEVDGDDIVVDTDIDGKKRITFELGKKVDDTDDGKSMMVNTTETAGIALPMTAGHLMVDPTIAQAHRVAMQQMMIAAPANVANGPTVANNNNNRNNSNSNNNNSGDIIRSVFNKNVIFDDSSDDDDDDHGRRGAKRKSHRPATEKKSSTLSSSSSLTPSSSSLSSSTMGFGIGTLSRADHHAGNQSNDNDVQSQWDGRVNWSRGEDTDDANHQAILLARRAKSRLPTEEEARLAALKQIAIGYNSNQHGNNAGSGHMNDNNSIYRNGTRVEVEDLFARLESHRGAWITPNPQAIAPPPVFDFAALVARAVSSSSSSLSSSTLTSSSSTEVVPSNGVAVGVGMTSLTSPSAPTSLTSSNAFTFTS
jgi:hypothetical protein